MTEILRVTRAATAIVLLLWGINVVGEDTCGTLGKPRYDPKQLPDVVVVVTKAQQVGRGLRFRWVITNESDRAVDVFSSALHGLTLSWDTDTLQHKLVVNATLTEPDSGTANDVPRMEFTKLLPHSSIEGAFDDPDFPIDLTPYTSIELVVGYGADVPRLLRAMNLYYRRCGNPLTLLVRWQKLAHSKPVTLAPDLGTKYREVRSYEVRPGVLMTPTYSEDGRVCEMVLEKRHTRGTGFPLDSSFSETEIKQLLDQLAPEAERGRKLTNATQTVVEGNFEVTEYVYEGVFVRLYKIRRSEPSADIPVTGVIIRWRARRCGQAADTAGEEVH